MKNGMPSKEHAKGSERRDQMEAMSKQAKRGGEHLREHMREEARPIDRSYCEPMKDRH